MWDIRSVLPSDRCITSTMIHVITLVVAWMAASPLSAQDTWNWSHAIDKTGLERIADIATDANGNIYAVGTYDHSSFLDLVPGPFGLPSASGSTDVFLVKLGPAGNVLWRKRIGGVDPDQGKGIAIAPNGNIYITGGFKGTLSNGLLGNILSSLTATGDMDMFLACFDAVGNMLWIQRAGGTDEDLGISVAANASGVFVHGRIRSQATFGPITITPPFSGKDHPFLVKYPLTGGAPQWVKYAASGQNNVPGALVADENGVYAIGNFKNNFLQWRTHSNSPIANVSCQNGSQNIYITSFTNNGGVSWHVAVDEPGTQSAGNAIALACRKVIIAGRVHHEAVFPGNFVAQAPGNEHDMLFVAGLDRTTGITEWMRTASGPQDHVNTGLDLHTGANQQIYLSGTFQEELMMEDSTVLIGLDKQDYMVARLDIFGNWQWVMHGSAMGDEIPLAIATDPAGNVIMAGVHTESIQFGPSTEVNSNNENIFITSFQDDSWEEWPDDPSKWTPPAAVCSASGPIGLSAQLSGTWSGTQVSEDGSFDPTGLTGNIPITYEVTVGDCSFNTTRNVLVTPPATATIEGPEALCSGTGAQLGLNGLPDHCDVIEWQQSSDGIVWDPIAASGNTPIDVDLAGDMLYRAKLFSPGCGTAFTPEHSIVFDPGVNFTCPADTMIVTDPGECTGTFDHSIAIVDHCGTGTIAYSHPIGTPFPVGSTTVEATIMDGGNEVGTCTFTMNVIDQQAPEVQCPAHMVLYAQSGTCGRVVSFNHLLFENCTANVVSSPPSGTFFPVGTSEVTITATDDQGNTGSCTFSITVNDPDTDNDGEPGCTDGCPFDPLKTDPGLCGCGTPDIDTDNDGTPDCNDGCPLDPLKLAPGSCGCGTADTDADGNGSADCLGACVGKFYLNAVGNGSDLPKAILKTTYPTRSALSNYDPNMDSTPGIMVKKGGSGVSESDGDQYQLWSIPGSGIDGEIALRFWSALKDFDGDKSGILRVYLADCSSSDDTCIALAEVTISRNQWHASNSSWIEENVNFGHVTHTFTTGRRLAVKMIVDNDSGDDMWFAYDALPFPAALSIGSDLDTDGDGVADCLDACPTDSLKQDPGTCGCGSPEPGTLCDDGDPATVNDKISADCQCAGTLLDCAGVPNGTAYTDNCGSCVGGNTGETACIQDCNGDWGGSASIDNCGNCVGGNTAETACIQDCNGDWGGSASIDNCGNCVGGNTAETACIQDCNGDWGGTASIDNCGNCVGGNTGETACIQDCNGEWGGSASIDNCGNCVEGNTGEVACIQDCNGDWGGSASIDNCGNCVGGNTGETACIQDCNGDWGGSASIDNCGNCVGGNTGETACIQDCNGDWGGSASIDNCGNCVGGNTGETACIQDCNGDWGGSASIDNCGNCVSGNTGETACIQDCNGDWGGTASIDNCGNCVEGNTGETACIQDCNGDWGGSASIDNCGNCVGGNTGETACIQDCNGDWGGSASIDNCGNCVGGNTGETACIQDCNGDWGGSASIDNCGNCVEGNTGETACIQDCNGDWGGSASIDNCGNCVGGNTGETACIQDCNGDWGGSASIDNCGNCVGGNTGETACIQDCNGDWGGSASIDNCGNCVGGNTGETACIQDCNGDWGGSASIDNCGNCVGGNTGETACIQDCNGDWGGSASIDNCGNCVGGNTGETACIQDCNGDWGGSASIDNCGNCVGGNTGETACIQDCNGDWGGSASIDNCGNCVGGNTGETACIQDCNGDWGGSASIDNCGNCVGGNTGETACIQDCNGDWGGSASIDNCGNCVGGNTGETACIQDCNGDWGGSASIDNCGNCVGGNTGETACIQDCNGDWGGSASIDNCGNCVEGNTGEVACIQDCNGDWGGSASIDNCGNCVGGNTGETACIMDCNGVWGGSAFPGTSCDDGDPCTINDVIGSDCICSGTPSVPDATFYYSDEEFCTNGIDPTPYIASLGGAFSAISQGLEVDPASGVIDLSATTPGVHTVQYAFDGVCPNIYLNTITINIPPSSAWTAPGPMCSNNGTIDPGNWLDPDAIGNGNWNGPGIANNSFDPTGLSGAVAIAYTVSGNGCTSTTINDLHVMPTPIANAGENAEVCGNQHHLQAAGSGEWTVPAGISIDQPASPDAMITSSEFGHYTLIWTVEDNGCTDQDTVTISFLDPGTGMFADAGPDQRLSIHGNTNVTGNTLPGASVQWQLIEGSGLLIEPNALQTAIHGLGIGQNTIVLSATLNQCASATDTIMIIVDELFIPQAFSPNNDGMNDRFEITAIEAYPANELQVFNRWGQDVYSTEGYKNDWDGRSRNGNALPDDTYFYVLNLGDGTTYNGFVIIKR